MRFTLGILLVFSALFLVQCVEDKDRFINYKYEESDPFKTTIPESQYFTISATENEVVKAEKGTVIVFPKGCFLDENNKVVKEDIVIEIAESLTLDQMILSNLTTTSKDQLLETDGMIFFSATANGKELKVNPDIPIYVEIPTHQKKANMMAYKGSRDKDGNMEWTEPKELDNFLVQIDLDLLDFRAPGIEEQIIMGLNSLGQEEISEFQIDSTYYSISTYEKGEFQDLLEPQNEPYDSRADLNSSETEEYAHLKGCGIDPASIAVLQSDEYQNTFIATREFEKRMRAIHEYCDQEILTTYLQNLDLNLYEVDRLIAERSNSKIIKDRFEEFYAEGATTIENNETTKVLKSFYEQQLKKVRQELFIQKQELIKKINTEKNKNKQIESEYKEVLRKRESQRMQTYGFEWTNTGWINIDRGTQPKSWG